MFIYGSVNLPYIPDGIPGIEGKIPLPEDPKDFRHLFRIEKQAICRNELQPIPLIRIMTGRNNQTAVHI